MAMRLVVTAFLGLLVTTSATGIERASVTAPIERTVYVTVTANDAPVPDLSPADFVVKEGGKEREIVKAVPATTPMRLALAIEEQLIADNNVRMAIFEFMKRTVERAQISLITIGLRNNVVVDFTSSPESLVGGINKLSLNPPPDSAVAEGVLDLASRFAEAKSERPVIVVVSFSGGQAGVAPRTVLDRLRDSGALMHSVTLSGASAAAPLGSLSDQSGREQVLGDGPKQSGGRRIEVTSTAQITRALQQIANDLASQYAISYTLPDGVKPDRRFNITVKRRGTLVRAPSAIPDR
jgi:VWFA-related protein